ncbi:MAG: hypothetical protein CVV13_01785 [Gammaproteobacteria bacterium HGW-Gammaproteobacteria-3]|nr:MAG: hypothetical protein CVV13_01785 [Gammaproteobacteria bacterium HGW-Gammaproteobacteria-3]
MAVRSLRILGAFLAGDSRPPAHQRQAIPIILPPQPGAAPSDKPPVRIFIGSEAAQFRAERALVWSVQRARDPARCYEIYLMRDFAGFKRRLWLTGFTNYRFAIPELAGGQGRAIYNDADQIYLQDPALLFDTPMAGHGVLSIHDHDTSVMLIDCARMADLWNWQSAQTTRNRKLERQMRAVPGLWGELDGAWNARDEEYAPGLSALVHYTTIHTQPWRPTPRDYVYGDNAAGELWFGLEREADAAGFQLFSADRPSPEFAAAAGQHLLAPHSDLADIRRLLADSNARSLYYCGAGAADTIKSLAGIGDLTAAAIATATPETEPVCALVQSGADVVYADGLERLPDLDIAWLLERLFTRARLAVLVTVDLTDAKVLRCPQDDLWWYGQLAAAGARHPHCHWRLVVRQKRFPARRVSRYWSGGALLHTPPSTWVLLYYKTGHQSQTLGVADALGWPYQTREIRPRLFRYTLAALRCQFVQDAGLDDTIRPPWPDVIIASGWLPGLVARWIVQCNHGATRLILMGRRGGPVGESQDLAIQCRHFDLPPHPQHIETVLPPSKVDAQSLAQAAARWPALFGDGAHPRVVLLVGGDCAQYELNADTAKQMASRVRRQIDTIGGTLAVVTSRRTRPEAQAALQAGAGENALSEAWRPQAKEDNPYLGYLAAADILIVTGDSESMLAEAVNTGKPVYIYPLPTRPPDLRQRLTDWVIRQAQTGRLNARGSRRPQQGLHYLCARLIEQRIMLPQRNIPALQQALVERGVARLFEDSLATWQPPVWQEIETLAQQIHARWPQAGAPQAPANPPETEQHPAAHA